MSKKISIILLIFISVVLGLWIWSAAVPKNSITLGGSTSVNPFMQKLTKKYYESDEHANDFIYNSTGSQAGVGGVEKEMYAAGFISKDINSATLSKGNDFLDLCGEENSGSTPTITRCGYDSELIQKDSSVSKRESYVALEFAIDAIGIIYNAPDYWNEKIDYNGLSLTLNDLADFKISDSNGTGKTLLADIYSGKKQWKDIAYVLIEPLNKEESKSTYNAFKALIDRQPGTKLVTFTREDGSGTRSAFSDLTGIKDMSSSNVVNSNGSMIENMQRAPSLGYVSNAFLTQLSDEGPIKLAGIDGMKLGIGQDGKPKEVNDFFWWPSELSSDEFIREKYTFKRPFISIFNLYNKNLDALVELFDYIASKDSDDVFKSEGLVKEMKFQSLNKNGGTYA
ncbi:phosphate ABC transporter substrate-binding protein [Spiroplasma monobiae]|uniref:Phosphate ABC transporter substrate-binding protein n=1 Tax=Spiroplasma monobiae MQ-1 TaxID=1336748 RepID=A0A2K9LWZ9_SPISQ|nr:phosphate ABC transporter substrate-binding protein [Spiroplasma monobiae]AUM62895.1 phosphate ABC transporter substrate-binding protein [Spiroplasma monobiae MQ-1]